MIAKQIVENTKKTAKTNIIGGIIWMTVCVLLFIVFPVITGVENLIEVLIMGVILTLIGIMFLLIGIRRAKLSEKELKIAYEQVMSKKKNARIYDGPLNKDIKRRDELIFGDYDPLEYSGNSGGVRKFNGLSAQRLRQLLEENFTDPDIDQNGSPSIMEMLEFSEKWNSKYVFGGYAVEIWRDDYRVSLDSIWREDLENLSEDERKAFMDFVGEVDELDEENMSAWWD